MAFGDTVVANYDLSAAVVVFNDVPTAGWWTFDILIGYTDGHALQTAAGTLTLDAMKGASGGATGYSEGGSAEVIFKAAGKNGVHYTTPLRYYSGTPYATLTLLSSNASDTSVEVSVTPRRVEVDTRPNSLFELLEMIAEGIIELTAEQVWLAEGRTLSDGAITSATFDGETAFPQAAAVPDVNVTELLGSEYDADMLVQLVPVLFNAMPFIAASQGGAVVDGSLVKSSSSEDEAPYILIRNAAMEIWDTIIEEMVEYVADDYQQYPIDTIRVTGTPTCYVPSTYIAALPAGQYIVEWKRTIFHATDTPAFSETRTAADPTTITIAAYWDGSVWRPVKDLAPGSIKASSFDQSTAFPQTAVVPDVNVSTVSGSAPAADAMETAALAGLATASGVAASIAADKTGYKLASDGLDTVATTAPSGVASNFREMVVQTWRRFFKKNTLTSTTLTTFADNGTTPITTQTVSDNSTTQTVGSAT